MEERKRGKEGGRGEGREGGRKKKRGEEKRGEERRGKRRTCFVTRYPGDKFPSTFGKAREPSFPHHGSL
jgi:hypothetical protein